MKLKLCPKCGYPEGLIACPRCHAEYEKDPWIPRKPAAVFQDTHVQEQLFTDESEKK